jgi:hypothetical protein
MSLTSTLLKSSKDLGWSTLLAELCSYGQREGPPDLSHRMPKSRLRFVARTKDS